MTEQGNAAKPAEAKPPVTDVKGKGKAVEEPKKADPKPYDVEDLDDDDDEDDDMEEAEDEDDDEEEEEDMAEIDPSNIVGRRTRGKKIDYAKEAQAAGNELEDDEEDDEDFVEPPEKK